MSATITHRNYKYIFCVCCGSRANVCWFFFRTHTNCDQLWPTGLLFFNWKTVLSLYRFIYTFVPLTTRSQSSILVISYYFWYIHHDVALKKFEYCKTTCSDVSNNMVNSEKPRTQKCVFWSFQPSDVVFHDHTDQTVLFCCSTLVVIVDYKTIIFARFRHCWYFG